MADRLTLAELAERCGTGSDRITALVDLGILQPEGGTFARRDVMRARVVADLEASGIDAGQLAAALASGHLTLGYLESGGRRHPRSQLTGAEIADQMGVPFQALERIYVAFGLPAPRADEQLHEEDLGVLRVLPVLFGAGLDEGAVLPLARVWGDGVRRIAQYLPHYFHKAIEGPFRGRGLRDNEAYETAIRDVGLRMGRSGEDLLGWLFRRHSEVFMTEHHFAHVETALEDAGVRRRAPRASEAVAFADLSGYTRLTEESGDEVAAEASLRLAQLANEIAARHHGSVVKLLGDGVYLHFRDPGDAVRGSLEIVESTQSRGLPPAHVGVNAGPMLYDEGDYFGRTVNIAARIANQASAGEVYVGESVAEAVSDAGLQFVEIGDVELKGIPEPVRILHAVRASLEASA